ncbi:unnamed protein product, partial [Linum tenue]
HSLSIGLLLLYQLGFARVYNLSSGSGNSKVSAPMIFLNRPTAASNKALMGWSSSGDRLVSATWAWWLEFRT